MISKYLIEYMGTLLICATVLYTNTNPILVGLAHASALYIGKEYSLGHFSPLVVFMNYSLGRLSLTDALKNLIVECLAALSVVLTYMYL